MAREIVILFLRWLARVWGGVVVSFIVIMTIAYAKNPDGPMPTPDERWGMFFFLFLLPTGLVLAYKWELIGGIINVLGIVGFHIAMAISDHLAFDPLMDSMAIPGIIYIFVAIFDIENYRLVKTDKVEQYDDI